MNIGVMKDQKVKVRDLHVSYTLGDSGDWNTLKIETRLLDERFPSVMGVSV
jgi:hypothetical protein